MHTHIQSHPPTGEQSAVDQAVPALEARHTLGLQPPHALRQQRQPPLFLGMFLEHQREAADTNARAVTQRVLVAANQRRA